MELRGAFVPAILILTSVWAANSSSLRDGNGLYCASQGRRFPKFTLEGKLPRMSVKGPDDLTLCRIYRKKTCCTAAQTHPALIAIRKLASDGEGSQDCIMFWEAMECAICDPMVGVQQGPPVLCNSFCESLLNACRDAFFSFDSINQVLNPCGPKDIICARATEWASNGTEFCQLAGFSVPSSRHIVGTFCFDGKPRLDTGERVEKTSAFNRRQSSHQRLRKFLKCLDQSDVILWAVGGLVLTAGAIWIRRRCVSSSQHKKAAMLRLVQEAKSKQQTSRSVMAQRSGKKAAGEGEASRVKK